MHVIIIVKNCVFNKEVQLKLFGFQWFSTTKISALVLYLFRIMLLFLSDLHKEHLQLLRSQPLQGTYMKLSLFWN